MGEDMTNVRQKLVAALAAAVLALGCAGLLAMPQAAHAVPLTAGTTQAAAVALPLTGKNLKASADTSFSSTTAKHWYKFTTSSRNSTYKVTVESKSGYNIDVNLYAPSGSVISDYFFSVLTKKSKKYYDLDRNSTYYIELKHYTNTSFRADYKITLQEVIKKPTVPAKFYACSKAKKKIQAKYRACDDATGYQVAYKKGASGKWVKKKTTKRSYTIKNLKKSKKYYVKVRAYRTVNKKDYYGKWSGIAILKPNGKNTKVYA